MPNIKEILHNKNKENFKVIEAISDSLIQIEKAAEVIFSARSKEGKVVLLEDNEQTKFISEDQIWSYYEKLGVNINDVLFIISSLGQSAHFLSALRTAKRRGFKTICITFNPSSIINELVDVAIVPILGNDRSLSMEELGVYIVKEMLTQCVEDKVQESVKQDPCEALIEKGINSIMTEAGISDYELAKRLLLKFGSVHKAVDYLKNV